MDLKLRGLVTAKCKAELRVRCEQLGFFDGLRG